jgi:tetratricopeptide (TPR) repeat protein
MSGRRATGSGLWATLSCVSASCAFASCGAAADHERLGDRHFRASEWAEAQAEYEAAVRGTFTPEVWAKLGESAHRSGDLAMAVTAYERLSEADAARTAEAARGLERVARTALRNGKADPALTAAVVALRRIAPDRPLGRLAGAAEAQGTADRVEELSLMPSALASADASSEVNSLLLRWATGLRATTACEEAISVYRMAVRRNPGLEMRKQAGEGLASCALQLGLDAFAANRASVAEQWFVEATQADPSSPAGVRARLGWGDAREAQGDLMGAAIVWQTVVGTPGAPDSLKAQARERISRLATAGGGDST